MSSPLHVVVVDDHPAFRKGVIAALEATPEIASVLEAEDTANAIAVIRNNPPIDLALVDLHLGEEGGGSCTKALLERFPSLRIVILTAFANDPEGFRALRAGATGWLLKTATISEINSTLQDVMGGKIVLASDAAPSFPNEPLQLEFTPRETEIIQAIVDGNANRTIAQQLGISESTVKYHLDKIFRKLEVDDRTQAALKAVKAGIVSSPV